MQPNIYAGWCISIYAAIINELDKLKPDGATKRSSVTEDRIKGFPPSPLSYWFRHPDRDTCSGLNLLNDRSDEPLCLTSGPLLSVNGRPSIDILTNSKCLQRHFRVYLPGLLLNVEYLQISWSLASLSFMGQFEPRV